MHRRLRSLIGTLFILVFVCFYALLAMALAESRLVDLPKFAQTVVYLVLGLAWILPVMPVIRWMERPKVERLRGSSDVELPTPVP